MFHWNRNEKALNLDCCSFRLWTKCLNWDISQKHIHSYCPFHLSNPFAWFHHKIQNRREKAVLGKKPCYASPTQEKTSKTKLSKIVLSFFAPTPETSIIQDKTVLRHHHERYLFRITNNQEMFSCLFVFLFRTKF